MLLTLAIIMYASLLCWAFGYALIHLLKKISKTSDEYRLNFPLTSLVGFAFITVTAGYLSLFVPLGHWAIHAGMIAFSLIVLLRFGGSLEIRKEFGRLKQLSLPVRLFGVTALLLLLVLSSWEVYYPDSIGYHLQVIKWVTEFKAVPGIVHLNKRFALQSSWFIGCSLFNFSFIGLKGVTFINSAILFWFIWFMSDCFESLLKTKKYSKQVLTVFMVILVFWSFSMFRITAMSPSPDFPTTLIVWSVFYFLISRYRSEKIMGFVDICLLFLLSAFAVAMKFSAIPIALVGLVLFLQTLRQKRFGLATIGVTISALVVLPILVRNVISSGYLFYPSPVLDLFQVDWKLDLQIASEQFRYINAYAKVVGAFNGRTSEEVVKLNLQDWIFDWWKLTYLSDKIVLCLVLLSFPIGLIRIRKILKSSLSTKICLLTSVAGSIFWFVLAPDPRFGWSFLMPIPVIILTSVFSVSDFEWVKPIYAKLLLFGLIALICSYTVYRFAKFFTPPQMLEPMGAKQIPYTKINCGNQVFSLPTNREDCGDLDLPCAEDSCENIQFRGASILSGFKAQSSP